MKQQVNTFDDLAFDLILISQKEGGRGGGGGRMGWREGARGEGRRQ